MAKLTQEQQDILDQVRRQHDDRNSGLHILSIGMLLTIIDTLQAPEPAPAAAPDFQAVLDILQSMITAMEPLDIKFPGEYSNRIGVLQVAMASIREYAMYEAPVPAPSAAPFDPNKNFKRVPGGWDKRGTGE